MITPLWIKFWNDSFLACINHWLGLNLIIMILINCMSPRNKSHICYWFKLGGKKNLKVFWELWKIGILGVWFESSTNSGSNHFGQRQTRNFQTIWFKSNFTHDSNQPTMGRLFRNRFKSNFKLDSNHAIFHMFLVGSAYFIRIRINTWFESWGLWFKSYFSLDSNQLKNWSKFIFLLFHFSYSIDLKHEMLFISI